MARTARRRRQAPSGWGYDEESRQERRPKKRRGKRNPPEAPGWGTVIGGLLAAAGIGYAGYKLYNGPGAPPQQHFQPQAQQFAPGMVSQPFNPQMQGMGQQPAQLTHGSVVEFSQNGIPVVNLPAESAMRTAQARRHMPNMFQPAGMQQGGVPQQGQVQTETFGGEENTGNQERF